MIREKIERAKKHIFDGLHPTQKRPMKMPIIEEHHIMTIDLHEYPNLEKRFNEYELVCQSKPPWSYNSNLVCKFFANYIVMLEKDCLKGSKVADMRNKARVLMRGVRVNIFDHTIN